MKKTSKAFITGALLGVFVGLAVELALMGGAYLRATQAAKFWEVAQMATADAWVSDRKDWAAGKAFTYRHGQYNHEW